MRRLTTAFAAMSLLTLVPATPALAGNPNADLGVVAFCKVDVPTNHPDQHVGNCVGFQSLNFRDNYNGLVSHLCQYVESTDPEDFYMAYDSYSECVTDGASVFFG